MASPSFRDGALAPGLESRSGFQVRELRSRPGMTDELSRLPVSCRNGYHGRAMNDSTEASWWKRLSGGLKRTSAALGDAISDLSKSGLDAATLEELEAELIRADLGPETAGRVAAALGEGRFKIGLTSNEVKAVLAVEIEKVLSPVAKPLEVTTKPFIILVAGVNGSGKTTTIGKLAAKFRSEGKSVMMAAGAEPGGLALAPPGPPKAEGCHGVSGAPGGPRADPGRVEEGVKKNGGRV